MHNLITPVYARKQAQQRWLYSTIACACVVLGFLQLRYALTTASTKAEPIITQPIKVMPELIAPEVPALMPAPTTEEPNYTTLDSTPQLLDKPNPCADLTPPDYQITAVLWQQQGELLVLRSPLGRHLHVSLGQHLEQSKWVLQSIDKHSITWQHQEFLCNVIQAIKAPPNQPLRY